MNEQTEREARKVANKWWGQPYQVNRTFKQLVEAINEALQRAERRGRETHDIKTIYCEGVTSGRGIGKKEGLLRGAELVVESFHKGLNITQTAEAIRKEAEK